MFSSMGLLPSKPSLASAEAFEAMERATMRSLPRSLIGPDAPLDVIRREFYAELQSISYLGPLRSHPARHYIASGADRETVGNRGERTPQVLYRRRTDLLPRISDWFEELGIPYRLDIVKAGNAITGEIMSIVLEDRKGLRLSPSDVGFGIGQLLPILVEGVVSTNKIICVEQPEIHLHPKLQAHVADFLIDTAISQPSTPNRSGFVKEYGGNQWIVETHSEALMLRLMRRIGSKIPPEFVSVLYVEPVAEGRSRVYQLRLDESGDFIDEWPDGFFEERYKEIFGGRR
jgi:hypothetical protein